MTSTIYTNGTILTLDPANPSVDAVLVRDTTIHATGTLAELRDLAPVGSSTFDLEGGCLLPGFNDSHAHPIILGAGLFQVNASPVAVTTLSHIISAFRARMAETPTGWLVGWGYDESRLDIRRHPTRDDLDQVSPHRPILLRRRCGHLGVTNTAGLAAAGISDDTPDPQGGEFQRDAAGRLTGLLKDEALEIVKAIAPAPPADDIARQIRAAGDVFLRHGITSVAESKLDRIAQLKAYEALATAGDLPFRVYTMPFGQEMLDHLTVRGLRTGSGDAWLRIGPAKFIQDGSGGGRTAAISVAYPDEPDNLGITYFSPEELEAHYRRAHEAGFQLATHAIGDRAITMVLDAYERTLGDEIRGDHRARIEHCGICTPAILDRMAALGIFAAPQPTFVHYLGDSYLENFSPEQLELAYPLRAFQDRGIPFSISSDVTATPCDSMVNLFAAISRKTQNGNVLAEEQAITIEEALRAYTGGGAFGSFEESIKGRLQPGMLADMVVLSADPRSIAPDAIPEVEVRATIVDGAIRYSAP